MEMLSNLVLAISWFNFARNLLIGLFLFSCLLLIGVVLLQKGRGGGISSAFGGAMGSSPFGTKTGDVFTWITVVLAGIFLLGAMVLNVIVVDTPADTGFVEPPAAPAAGAGAGNQTGAAGDPTLGQPASPGGAEFIVPIAPSTQPEGQTAAPTEPTPTAPAQPGDGHDQP